MIGTNYLSYSEQVNSILHAINSNINDIKRAYGVNDINDIEQDMRWNTSDIFFNNKREFQEIIDKIDMTYGLVNSLEDITKSHEDNSLVDTVSEIFFELSMIRYLTNNIINRYGVDFKNKLQMQVLSAKSSFILEEGIVEKKKRSFSYDKRVDSTRKKLHRQFNGLTEFEITTEIRFSKTKLMKFLKENIYQQIYSKLHTYDLLLKYGDVKSCTEKLYSNIVSESTSLYELFTICTSDKVNNMIEKEIERLNKIIETHPELCLKVLIHNVVETEPRSNPRIIINKKTQEVINAQHQIDALNHMINCLGTDFNPELSFLCILQSIMYSYYNDFQLYSKHINNDNSTSGENVLINFKQINKYIYTHLSDSIRILIRIMDSVELEDLNALPKIISQYSLTSSITPDGYTRTYKFDSSLNIKTQCIEIYEKLRSLIKNIDRISEIQLLEALNQISIIFNSIINKNIQKHISKPEDIIDLTKERAQNANVYYDGYEEYIHLKLTKNTFTSN